MLMKTEEKIFSKMSAHFLLETIKQYESLSRGNIAANVLYATKHLNLSEYKLCKRIAEICGLNNKTVQLWLIPDWHAKFTLKSLAQISIAFHIPFFELLKKRDLNYADIRPSKCPNHHSYRERMEVYIKESPEKSITAIAEDLGMAESTVRRHLKNIKRKE